jgi:tetratricopeptide (TPR) repeat protein
MSIRSVALAAAGLLFALHAGAEPAGSVAASPSDGIQSITVTSQRNPSRWFRAQSQHVILYSDTSQDEAQRLLDNLERLDDLLRIYTKGYARTGGPESRITLYYTARFDDLARLGAELGSPTRETVGVYSSCNDGVAGFGARLEAIDTLDNDKLARYPLNVSLSFLFEAYARHFLYRHTDLRAPTWFIDGFAHYFSTVRFTDSRMAVGRWPTILGRYFSLLDGEMGNYALYYRDVLEQNENAGVGGDGHLRQQVEYAARSWLLVHYALSSEDNRRRLGAYLKAFYDGVPSVQAFERSFGIPVDDLSTAMWRYRLKGLQVLHVDRPGLPRAVVDVDVLPEASSDYLLAEASLKSCPSGAARQATIERVLGAAPPPGPSASVLVQRTVARALIYAGRPADALPYLDAALRKDDADADLHLLAGLAHLRLAESGAADRTSRLAEARRRFARAVELAPALPGAALGKLCVDIMAGGEPGKDAIDDVLAAWRGSRDVGGLGRTAALVYAWRGDGIRAANLLRSMASNGRDPYTAAWAADWQRRLDAGLTRDAIRAGLAAFPWSGPAFREWTIDATADIDRIELSAGLQKVGKLFFAPPQPFPFK